MKLFQHISGYKPAKNRFNISAGNAGTLDLGELVPVYVNELMPGDRVRINVQSIVRLQPLVSPMLQKLLIRFECFFVPARVLDENFKDFYTGGKDGKNNYVLPVIAPKSMAADATTFQFGKYDLGDYFGLPIGKTFTTNSALDTSYQSIIAYPFMAYNKIINDYYMDENVDNERDLNDTSVYARAYSKDYFTSALPFQQRGNPGAFSWDLSQILDGAHAEWTNNVPLSFSSDRGVIGTGDAEPASGVNLAKGIISTNYTGTPTSFNRATNWGFANQNGSTDYPWVHIVGAEANIAFNQLAYVPKNGDWANQLVPLYDETSRENLYAPTGNVYKLAGLNDNQIVGGEVGNVGFNVADLRYQVQLQKYLERNARAGYRFNEYIFAHFGQHTSDRTIDRAQFIGSAKTEIQVSEIPQTSATVSNSPQGTLAGRGIGTIGVNLGQYRAEEPGYILVLQSITPAMSYASQGIDRMWTRKTRFDFYTPEFAHLSEQPILKKELYYNEDVATDDDTFGYQGIYDEYRWKKSIITSDFRDNMSHWKMARSFSNVPELNSDFIHIDPVASYNTAPFAVEDVEFKRYIYDTYVDVLAFRPMPRVADPGFVDHF